MRFTGVSWYLSIMLRVTRTFPRPLYPSSLKFYRVIHLHDGNTTPQSRMDFRAPLYLLVWPVRLSGCNSGNNPCLFPWIYSVHPDKTLHGCIDDGGWWCATQYSGGGITYASGSGAWGWCGSDCPRHHWWNCQSNQWSGLTSLWRTRQNRPTTYIPSHAWCINGHRWERSWMNIVRVHTMHVYDKVQPRSYTCYTLYTYFRCSLARKPKDYQRRGKEVNTKATQSFCQTVRKILLMVVLTVAPSLWFDQWLIMARKQTINFLLICIEIFRDKNQFSE